MSNYFVSRKGVVKGPFNIKELSFLFGKGKLKKNDKISMENKCEWIDIDKSDIYNELLLKKDSYDNVKKNKESEVVCESKIMGSSVEAGDKEGFLNYKDKKNNYSHTKKVSKLKMFYNWFFEKNKYNSTKEWFFENLKSQKGHIKLFNRLFISILIMMIPLVLFIFATSVFIIVWANVNDGYQKNSLKIPDELVGKDVYKIVWDNKMEGETVLDSIHFFDPESKIIVQYTARKPERYYIEGWDKSIFNRTDFNVSQKNNLKYKYYEELNIENDVFNNIIRMWFEVKVDGSFAEMEISGKSEFYNKVNGFIKNNQNTTSRSRGFVQKVR